MSQIVTRKGPVGEDKDKRQTDSPVKDMKKKIAANAEKEKQAAEKTTEKSTGEKSGERPEKSTDKKERDRSTEKVEKKENKSAEKTDKKETQRDKSTEKVDKKERDKSTDKIEKKEKSADKKEKAPEKSSPRKEEKVEKKEEKAKEDNKEKTPKADQSEEKKKPEEKSKQNGARTLNGDQNGDTVSSEDEDLDIERDEIFPELTYEDSDGEIFERPTPEGLPSRSYTRRSQVKAARTPETPRPASDKLAETSDESKEKAQKLKDEATDRKLRSADSPKPEKKEAKSTDSPKKREEEKKEVIEIDLVIDVDNEDEARKPDTNYSRSRVKVSPYRRSTRHADVTCSSTAANYTGNNTTMEMDITETSSFIAEDVPYPDSPYLSGLRTIHGRRSYKPLKEMSLRNLSVNRSARSTASATASATASEPVRPTGTVVGRKRKPEGEGVEPAEEAGEDVVGGAADSKRPRLLQRLARPFRTLTAPRHAEIVGINTDLPLTAPVACTDAFDPEAIKPGEPTANTSAASAIPAPAPRPREQLPSRPLLTHDRQDPKRCVIA